MDREQHHWDWHAGLVRRAALGLVLYVASVVLFCILTASAFNDRNRLDELAQLGEAHRTIGEAYASLDDLAARLSTSRSMGTARSAIEPMARALERVEPAPSNSGVSRLPCLESWAEALRALQSPPYSLETPCDTRGAGSWRCQQGRERLQLKELGTFERGLSAVVELQTFLSMEVDCDETGTSPARIEGLGRVCALYRVIGETSWRQLHDLASEYTPPHPFVVSGHVFGRSETCYPARSPIQDQAAFAARVTGTTGTSSLRDFFRLSEKIGEEERAIAGRQQGVSAGTSGLVAMALSRTAGLCLLAIGGFLALAYSYYSARKLRALNDTFGLARRDEYRAFVRLSQVFTLPVFRSPRPGSLIEWLIALLSVAPWFAWLTALASLVALGPWAHALELATAVGLFALLALQLVMLGGFEGVRSAIVEAYAKAEASTDENKPKEGAER